jgi:hypothetical protein
MDEIITAGGLKKSLAWPAALLLRAKIKTSHLSPYATAYTLSYYHHACSSVVGSIVFFSCQRGERTFFLLLCGGVGAAAAAANLPRSLARSIVYTSSWAKRSPTLTTQTKACSSSRTTHTMHVNVQRACMDRGGFKIVCI